jgi:hypothetical protein
MVDFVERTSFAIPSAIQTPAVSKRGQAGAEAPAFRSGSQYSLSFSLLLRFSAVAIVFRFV